MLQLVILIVDLIGGRLIATTIGDAVEPKHAAFYGAGWQASMSGVLGVADQVMVQTA